MADSYELWGMKYSGFNLDHDAALPMYKVLKQIAKWFKDNEKEGTIEAMHTQCHPDDDTRFLTTVIWAEN